MNNTASSAAATLGSIKSAKKAKSSAANGAKGGRPRQDVVLARVYTRTGKCEELVRTTRGAYLITVDGGVQDARKTLTVEAAQAFYDEAAYQLTERP